jgi:ABC-type sugar transport system ATPase subunit
LSGGERQRVALGRAVVREPKAFLLDEPLSNLDPGLRVTTRTELALLHRRLEATMVYVTHDQEEALTLGTRIVVMRRGAVEQVGRPIEIFERPANTFVAEFIGAPAMNLLQCQLAATGQEVTLTCGPYVLPAGLTHLPESDSRLVLGIRPHDIHLVPAPGADMVGSIVVRQSLGSSAVLHVRPHGLPDVLVRVLVSTETQTAEGMEVGLSFKKDRLHHFSPEDGRRVD